MMPPTPYSRWHRACGSASARQLDTSADGGFTLIELAIAMTISVVILGLVMISITTFVTNANNGVALGQSVSKADYAITQIGRAIVAGDVIFDPTTSTETPSTKTGVGPGYSLRILSNEHGGATCMQWRVKTTQLQFRKWPNALPTKVSTWDILLTGVANAAMPVKPFARDSQTAYGNRLVDVDLVLQSTAYQKAASSKTTEVRSSFTALDAEYFPTSATQFCTMSHITKTA